jgi:hypothetical protein
MIGPRPEVGTIKIDLFMFFFCIFFTVLSDQKSENLQFQTIVNTYIVYVCQLQTYILYLCSNILYVRKSMIATCSAISEPNKVCFLQFEEWEFERL